MKVSGIMHCGEDGRGTMALTNLQTVQIALPAKEEYIDVVCLTLYGIASKIGFSYEDIEDLKVAVSEAFSNSVNKSSTDEGKVHVGFEMREGALRVSIKEEKSCELQPVAANVTSMEKNRPSMLSKGGLGLYLMQALVDEVEVRTESGTEIVLMKYYNRSEQTS